MSDKEYLISERILLSTIACSYCFHSEQNKLRNLTYCESAKEFIAEGYTNTNLPKFDYSFKLQFSDGREKLWGAKATSLDKVAHSVENLLRLRVLYSPTYQLPMSQFHSHQGK